MKSHGSNERSLSYPKGFTSCLVTSKVTNAMMGWVWETGRAFHNVGLLDDLTNGMITSQLKPRPRELGWRRGGRHGMGLVERGNDPYTRGRTLLSHLPSPFVRGAVSHGRHCEMAIWGTLAGCIVVYAVHSIDRIQLWRGGCIRSYPEPRKVLLHVLSYDDDARMPLCPSQQQTFHQTSSSQAAFPSKQASLRQLPLPPQFLRNPKVPRIYGDLGFVVVDIPHINPFKGDGFDLESIMVCPEYWQD